MVALTKPATIASAMAHKQKLKNQRVNNHGILSMTTPSQLSGLSSANLIDRGLLKRLRRSTLWCFACWISNRSCSRTDPRLSKPLAHNDPIMFTTCSVVKPCCSLVSHSAAIVVCPSNKDNMLDALAFKRRCAPVTLLRNMSHCSSRKLCESYSMPGDRLGLHSFRISQLPGSSLTANQPSRTVVAACQPTCANTPRTWTDDPH